MASMAKANLKHDEASRLHREAVGFLQAGKLPEGIARLKKAAKIAPGSAAVLKDLGTACWQAGKPAEAEKHYRAALKIVPQNPDVLNAAGAFLQAQGASEEAQELLRAAVRLQPGNFEALNNLGMVYLERQEWDGAEQYIDSALRLNPLWPNALYNKARILIGREKYAAAEPVLRRVLQMAPGHALAWTGLGVVMQQTDRHNEALPLMKRGVELYPQGRAGWFALINLLDLMAKLDEAQQAIAQARTFLPETAGLAVLEAKIARRKGGADAALDLMEGHRPGVPETPANDIFYFELAALYDKTKKYDQAFDSYAIAKRLWATGETMRKIDRGAMAESLRKFEETFTPAWVKSWRPVSAYTGTPTPVFLVGFPRSGTTLLGQILSSHPQIDLADESPALRAARDIIGRDYVQALPDLSDETVEKARTRFFEVLKAHGRDAARPLIVDKMPLNMIDAGLIHRLFPQAKFVLALRHPCDSVLSCFMQAFAPNPAMAQFTDIESSARFYDRVFRLWEHYCAVLPLDVHAIRYEDVVGGFRPAVESLLDFLGTGWDDRVLEYDRNAKERIQTRTPSYSQVTEKIYTTSRGRWHNYRKHLEPVLPILSPWAEKHGYDIL